MAANQTESSVVPAAAASQEASKPSGAATQVGAPLQSGATPQAAASQVSAVFQGGSPVLQGGGTLLQGGGGATNGNAPRSYSISTPQGPIQATQSSDGTINAEGGGQTLTASGQSNADGSWQSRTDYSQTGQSPYLTIQLASTPNRPALPIRKPRWRLLRGRRNSP
jgi:hypothetical protein